MSNQSPGSITMADIEIALSRAGASLYLRMSGDRYTATIVHGAEESAFSAQSMTDAIDCAAHLAGIELRQAVAA